MTPHDIDRIMVNFGPGNELSPLWDLTIIWTNIDLLPFGHLGTYYSEM